MARTQNNPFSRTSRPVVLLAILVAVVLAVAPRDATPDCSVSLQSLVDGAVPGAVVDVPACVYREKTVVDKPIVLQAAPGTEIRGSDMWSGWEKRNDSWTKGSLPIFEAHGRCSSETDRCLWPEQVFFDGKPLEQVVSDPGSGQFAVTDDRDVVLADDPAGHTVEVTVRDAWIVGRSDGVTIRGFEMMHAANDSQNGAIENNGHSHWTIRDNVLSNTHGAAVSMTGGKDLKLLGNEIHHGGQLGVHASGGEILLRANELHHNNTEGFDTEWEAGGAKTSSVQSMLADRNLVHHNMGQGLWCDVGCRNVTYSHNRIHHNQKMGINFEIGSTAEIFDNVLWENGWGKPGWGWGAGILSSSSSNVEIRDNVLAWNADGISVVSADREGTDHDDVTTVRVHHNIILTRDYPHDRYHNFALAWLQDREGSFFDPVSGNRGGHNNYWYPSPESSLVRFEWYNEGRDRLADFNSTPGEEGGGYLSDAEKDRVISSARVPSSPVPR